jgi:hypothetical protein
MNAESCDCEDIIFPEVEGELHILNDVIMNTDHIRIFLEVNDMVTFRLFKLHDIPSFPIELEEMSTYANIECVEINANSMFTEHYAQLSLHATEGNCSWSINYNGPNGESLVMEMIVWPEYEPEFLGELLELDEINFPYETTLQPGHNITARLL